MMLRVGTGTVSGGRCQHSERLANGPPGGRESRNRGSLGAHGSLHWRCIETCTCCHGVQFVRSGTRQCGHCRATSWCRTRSSGGITPPRSRLLEAGRGLFVGSPVKVGLAFALLAGAAPAMAGFARRDLAFAERAG